MSAAREGCCRAVALREVSSTFQPIARLEYPSNDREADEKEGHDRREADFDGDVAFVEEAPAEARDQVDDRIEERHLAPHSRQHIDGIERAAEDIFVSLVTERGAKS